MEDSIVRIQNNVAANFNYRQQDIRTKFVSKTTEMLANGLQINKAADDAAGLSISEKMRGQINGLAQAQRNIQAGIALLQTADSGMAEIANPNLVRLRELAIQAATDTVTSTERMLIQTEVNQILAEINSIAKNTKFNERPLLNLGESVTTVEPGGLEKLVDVPAKQRVIAAEVNIPDPPNPASFEVEAFFGTISGADWPDLNIVAPNGQKFGFSEDFLSFGHEQQLNKGENGFSAADSAWYTGFSATDEKIIFNNPIPGKWTIEIRNDGGHKDSTFKVRSNYLLEGGSPPTSNSEHVVEGQKELVLQTGANSDNNMVITLTNVTTPALKLTELSFTTRESAESALATIDSALNFVSQERSRFGSYTNRLSYNEQNVGNYNEQLTKAESVLRDTDVAKRITELHGHQVLLQAAQAIGAQTQQQAQNILQILQI